MKLSRHHLQMSLAAALCLSIIACVAVTFMTPTPAHAATTEDCSTGWCLTNFKNDPAGLGDPSNAKKYIGPTISLVINGIIILTALGAFVMFIFGAYKYMMSQGEPAKTAEARKTMQYAAAGVLITALVYVFILFYNNLWPKPAAPSCPAGQNYNQNSGTCGIK